MKSLMISLLLVVSCFPVPARAQAGEGKNDVERAGLAGRVKSVEAGRVGYTLKDGRSVEGRRVLVQKTTYDERGNKAEEVTYGEGGSPSQRLVYTYDAAGRNTGYEEQYSGASDKSLSKPRRHVYRLDAAGRRVEYTVYESDGSVASRFAYAYDAAGNKTEDAFYSWQGARTGRLVYAYDAGGRPLAQTAYDESDAVSWKLVNVYDPEGRKTEAAQYRGETLRYRFFYKYDGQGRVKEVETREFNAVPDMRTTHAPEPGRVVYTYDDERRTKEVATYDEHGTPKSRLVYASDERGDDAGVTELNADGSVKSREIHWYDGNVRRRTLRGVPSVEFVRDAQGNWTRKTFSIKPAGAEAAEPYWAEFREIVYY
jgi:hypothetical protein